MPPGILEEPDNKLNGGITRPFHIVANTWDERLRAKEDFIRDRYPIDGNWQSYIQEGKLYIPPDYQEIFKYGGVITAAPDNYLLLFGSIHWERYNLLLAKHIGLEPIQSDLARHVYSNAVKFDKLSEDGSIDVPAKLLAWAGITDKVAVLGIKYYAEVHDLGDWNDSQRKPEARVTLLERFRKMRLNRN